MKLTTDSSFDCDVFKILYSHIKENKVFVQIGTNNGQDTFNKVVKYSSPSKIILVEPNKEFNALINESYSSISNVFIENVAITDKSDELVKLVIPKKIIPFRKGHVKGKKTVNNVAYLDVNFTLLPMDDWGTEFESVEAKSMTFNDLCKKHNLTDIHLLMIDTEGYDCEIIKSIDFSKVKIDIIQYEKWNFPVSNFTRHGKKGKQYGIAGMKYVAKILKKQGYKFEEDEWNIIAIKN
jgi:FkbM family methyltransferase